MDGYKGLVILQQLEEYIPFMLEEEIIFIIFVGSIPSADCVTRWELERQRKASVRQAIFDSVRERQRQKLAKNSQMTF